MGGATSFLFLGQGCGLLRIPVSLRQGEQADPLFAFGLNHGASLNQLGQERGALLAGDADLGGDVTAPLALVDQQGVQDGLLHFGVLGLLLGGLAGLGGVALFQLGAQGQQLVGNLDAVLDLFAVQSTDSQVDSGNIGDLVGGGVGVSHSFCLSGF